MVSLKNLILIGGTMGVGKTATSRALQNLLPRCVFLDGDWCWDMKPFVVNDATKAMVESNIAFLLNSFLACPEYENVIFCWVMHQQGIIDHLLSRLAGEYRLFSVSLVCSEEALRRRIESDAGRDDRAFERSAPRLPLYEKIDSFKLDVSDLTAQDAAVRVYDLVYPKKDVT